MLQKCDIVSESFERIFSDLLSGSRFACQLLYNHVSRASIIHHFISVFFIYFSYHSSCRRDQFTAALILKFGIEDFTDPGLLKIQRTLTGCLCSFAFKSVLFTWRPVQTDQDGKPPMKISTPTTKNL